MKAHTSIVTFAPPFKDTQEGVTDVTFGKRRKIRFSADEIAKSANPLVVLTPISKLTPGLKKCCRNTEQIPTGFQIIFTVPVLYIIDIAARKNFKYTLNKLQLHSFCSA